jgi:excinuclease UvrABC nuclease subunit
MPEKWNLVWSPLKDLAEDYLALVPNSPGVYRLSYWASDSKIYVFYVGKSDNLHQRLREHFNKLDNNLCINRMVDTARCYFRYAIVNSETVRDGAERALYLHYKPQCNSQEPQSIDIEINFD